ncbi:MAG: PEP-utilizing enzyme [Patescibacteria group bacterium]|nr:PEP-utilizing enzyme [Patescibacteria group bacterium]
MKPRSVKILIEETNVNYHGWAAIADGFMHLPTVKNYLGLGFTYGFQEIQDNSGRYGFDIVNWNALGAACLRKLQDGSLSLKKLENQHKIYGKKINRICREVEKTDLKTIGLKQAAQYLKQLWPLYLELNALGSIPVLSDYDHNLLTNKLLAILRFHDVRPEKIQDTLNALITPENKTLFWQEQKELLLIAAKYKKFREAHGSLGLLKHSKKYAWLNYGYQGPLSTFEDFSGRLKKIYGQKTAPKTQLREHEAFLKKIETKRKKTQILLGLNKKEKLLFAAARNFTYLKIYRVGVRHYFSFTCDTLFAEMGKRLKLGPKIFQFATREEILGLATGKKIDTKKIQRRLRYLFEYITPKSRTFLAKPAAKQIQKKLVIEEKIEASDTLKGQAAFLGKARGKAKLVFSAKDLPKVQHGDILVAISTNPDFLPAMYRANAFVTDHGGITSHAAIVAREMKKPCIIGTKIATKIFKDGDIIEIDASLGIVRKIS